MRKSFGSVVASLVAFAVCLAFVPVAGAATLMVALEQPAIGPLNAEQTVYFDAFVVDLDNTDERLDTFTLKLDAPTFSPQGVRFGPPVNFRFPEPANHPYVFGGIPAAVTTDFGSTHNLIQVGASASPAEVNVTANRNGLVRIPIIIPANPVPGLYPISIDAELTDFAGKGVPIATAVMPGGGILILPEPGGAALPGVGFAALLRRRRNARGVVQ